MDPLGRHVSPCKRATDACPCSEQWRSVVPPRHTFSLGLGSSCCDQTARRFSAEDLPVFRLVTTSKETFCPSLRLCIPACSTALMCTKTSLPPSSGWMNPKPFWPLNHFTVPVDMGALSLSTCAYKAAR